MPQTDKAKASRIACWHGLAVYRGSERAFWRRFIAADKAFLSLYNKRHRGLFLVSCYRTLLEPVDHPGGEIVEWLKVLAVLVLCCQPRYAYLKPLLV